MPQYTSFNNSGQQPTYDYQSYGSQQTPNDPIRRLLMVGGLFIGVIIIIVIGLNLISSSGDDPALDLSKVLAREQEVLRLIEEHNKNTRSLDAQTEVATIKAVVSSSTSRLSEFGVEVSAAAEAEFTDSTVDEQLEAAVSGTEFDAIFVGILKDQLRDNQTSLEQVFKVVNNDELKSTLNDIYENQQELL